MPASLYGRLPERYAGEMILSSATTKELTMNALQLAAKVEVMSSLGEIATLIECGWGAADAAHCVYMDLRGSGKPALASQVIGAFAQVMEIEV